jgi:hypothetical protein
MAEDLPFHHVIRKSSMSVNSMHTKMKQTEVSKQYCYYLEIYPDVKNSFHFEHDFANSHLHPLQFANHYAEYSLQEYLQLMDQLNT